MSKHTFPPFFEQRMREQLGDDWSSFATAHETESPVSIRFNPEKTKPSALPNRIPWTSNGFYLDERPSFTRDPLFHSGCYYVQEASSMFLEQAFLQSTDRDRALNVLDLCAAPGGKSTHLLSLLNKQGLLVTNEVIRARASVLAENIQKWGYNNVVVTNNDPQDLQRIPGFFDVIVADAPCSGEGLFRKDPDAMLHWSPDQVTLCARRQQRIIHDLWPALKEDGILIYSTCTYNQAENEHNLEWLAKEHEVEFVPLSIEKNWGIQVVEKPVLGYRFLPHRVQGEGFFISVIRKKAGEKMVSMRNRHSFMGPSKKILEQLNTWVSRPEEKTFIVRNDQVQFFPKDKAAEIEFLAKKLHVITAGTVLASVKHEKLIPEHAAALSVELVKENFNTVNVDLPAALQFLRKDTLSVTSGQRGFALVNYNGSPLGWVNVLENRINNLYPSEWRIRMSDKTGNG